MSRYVIEEQTGGAWIPANLPESPHTDDLAWALGVLRALSSSRFRVHDTVAPTVKMVPARGNKRTRVTRTRVRYPAVIVAPAPEIRS